MSKINEVRNKKFKCDECGKIFKGQDVKLIETPDNIQIITPPSPIIYIDKDDRIIGGGHPSKEKGDKVLACPNCNFIHLFGFTPA